MRKFLVSVALLAVVGAACAPEESTTTQPATGGSPSGTGTAEPATAANCMAAHEADLFEAGVLTVGTDNPAFPPWIINNKPENGKGFESAVAYEVATRLGFSESEVTWVVVPFNKSYAPGEKEFDFDINNISVTEERDQVVDFSKSYYDLTQALMVLKGSPFSDATTIDEIKDAVFGAQVGTTSLQFINTVIQPTEQAQVFDTTNDAKAALRNGQVDGLVLDLPTAYFEANFNTPNGLLVGQFENAGEYIGMLFEDGNPLRECVDLAIDEMTADGTLEQLQSDWLADYLAVPTIT